MTNPWRHTPPEVAASLDELEAPEVFRHLVDDLAKQEQLTSDPVTAGYVGVRPQVHGTISLYVHRSSVSVALEPERARRAAEKIGGSLQQKNPTTWFLRLKPEVVTALYEYVLELGLAALAKSVAGPAYEGGQDAARGFAAARPICGSCHQYELAANGTCLCGWGED